MKKKKNKEVGEGGGGPAFTQGKIRSTALQSSKANQKGRKSALEKKAQGTILNKMKGRRQDDRVRNRYLLRALDDFGQRKGAKLKLQSSSYTGRRKSSGEHKQNGNPPAAPGTTIRRERKLTNRPRSTSTTDTIHK